MSLQANSRSRLAWPSIRVWKLDEGQDKGQKQEGIFNYLEFPAPDFCPNLAPNEENARRKIRRGKRLGAGI